MPVTQIDPAVVLALSAAGKDPDLGKVRVKRGWSAEVHEGGPQRRLVISRGEQRIVLTRCPAAPDPGIGYPKQLPFVPNAVVWWTVAQDAPAATWINIRDTDGLASRLTAQLVSEGWSAESALLMARQKLTTLTRDNRRRLILWGRTQVLLYDLGVS